MSSGKNGATSSWESAESTARRALVARPPAAAFLAHTHLSSTLAERPQEPEPEQRQDDSDGYKDGLAGHEGALNHVQTLQGPYSTQDHEDQSKQTLQPARHAASSGVSVVGWGRTSRAISPSTPIGLCPMEVVTRSP